MPEVTREWILSTGLVELEEFRDFRAYGLPSSHRVLVEYMQGKFHLYSGEHFVRDDPTIGDIARLCDALYFPLKGV